MLLGNGAGSFGAATQFAAFDLPKTVRLADVTGDSRLDIVVGSGDTFGMGTISILPGNGNGTFGTRTDIGNGDVLSLLLTKDVNGDNRQDIITASFSTFVTTTTGVTVRLGNGNGTFGAASRSAIPLLTGVTLADVNKDNVLDLLTGDIDASTNTLGVRLGTGTGVFAAPITKTVAVQPDRILVADFTRGTNPDIVLSSSFSNVQLLTGSGDGSFANPVNSGVSAPLFFAANMGPDTDLDLITGEPPGLILGRKEWRRDIRSADRPARRVPTVGRGAGRFQWRHVARHRDRELHQ